MSRLPWTTLSDANQRRELPGKATRLTARARLARLFARESDPLKDSQRRDEQRTEAERRDLTMKRERAQQGQRHRPAKMVAKDQPQPVLKPIGALAREVQRKDFATRWAAERAEANRAERAARRKELVQVRQDWEATKQKIDAIGKRDIRGDPMPHVREMAKAFDTAQDRHRPAEARAVETINRQGLGPVTQSPPIRGKEIIRDRSR